MWLGLWTLLHLGCGAESRPDGGGPGQPEGCVKGRPSSTSRGGRCGTGLERVWSSTKPQQRGGSLAKGRRPASRASWARITPHNPALLVRGGNEAGRSSLGKRDRGHERYIPVQRRWRAPHSGFRRESLPWSERPATSLAWPPRLGTKGAQEDRQLPEERTCEASWCELRPRLGEGAEAGWPVCMVPEMVLRCHPLPRL